jgi:hypothetical protein
MNYYRCLILTDGKVGCGHGDQLLFTCLESMCLMSLSSNVKRNSRSWERMFSRTEIRMNRRWRRVRTFHERETWVEYSGYEWLNNVDLKVRVTRENQHKLKSKEENGWMQCHVCFKYTLFSSKWWSCRVEHHHLLNNQARVPLERKRRMRDLPSETPTHKQLYCFLVAFDGKHTSHLQSLVLQCWVHVGS